MESAVRSMKTRHNGKTCIPVNLRIFMGFPSPNFLQLSSEGEYSATSFSSFVTLTYLETYSAPPTRQLPTDGYYMYETMANKRCANAHIGQVNRPKKTYQKYNFGHFLTLGTSRSRLVYTPFINFKWKIFVLRGVNRNNFLSPFFWFCSQTTSFSCFDATSSRYCPFT